MCADCENIHCWFQRTAETAQPTMHKLWVWWVTPALFLKGRADDLDSEEQMLTIHSQLRKWGFASLTNSREDKAYNHIDFFFSFSSTKCILFFAWCVCVCIKMRTCSRKLSMGEVKGFVCFCFFVLTKTADNFISTVHNTSENFSFLSPLFPSKISSARKQGSLPHHTTTDKTNKQTTKNAQV